MNLDKRQQRTRSAGVALGISMVISALLAPSMVLASGAASLAGVASTITSQFTNLAMLITATAYLGGLGFAVGAILKFKQHKDNPTQVPIGTPVAMLMVAAAMIFLPTILGITGQSLFGSPGSVGGPTGVVFGSAAAGT